MQDRIDAVNVYYAEVPLKETFAIATGKRDAYRGLIIEVKTKSGITGYGEAVPVPYVLGETIQGVSTFLLEFREFLLGKNPFLRLEILKKMEQISAPHSAKLAVSMALWDVLGKHANLPLADLLGAKGKPIFTSATISIGSEKHTIESAEKLINAGFKALKMKVGLDLEKDEKRVKEVRALSSAVKIYLDANQGYSKEEAVKFANAVKKYRISFIEQPVKANDILALRYVKERSPVPIMADETVKSSKDALTILRADAADFINVKMTKAGSIEESLKLVNLAHTFNRKAMLGCMLSSPLLISAAFSVFNAGGFDFADLDGFLTFDGSPVAGGAYLKNGRLFVSKGNGLAVSGLNGRFVKKL